MKRERAGALSAAAPARHRKAGSADARAHEECPVVRKRLRSLHAPTAVVARPASPVSPSAAPVGSSAQLLRAQLGEFCEATPFERASATPEELLAWVSDMAADFFSELSALYDMLSEMKAPTDEARAMDELMRRVAAMLHATAPPNDWARARSVFSALIRVYIFLYARYFGAFVLLEVHELLETCWRRLLAFAMDHRLLDDAFLASVHAHVSALVAASSKLLAPSM